MERSMVNHGNDRDIYKTGSLITYMVDTHIRGSFTLSEKNMRIHF